MNSALKKVKVRYLLNFLLGSWLESERVAFPDCRCGKITRFSDLTSVG